MLKSQKWDEGGCDAEDIKQLGESRQLPFHHAGGLEEGLIVFTSLEMCWQIPDC